MGTPGRAGGARRGRAWSAGAMAVQRLARAIRPGRERLPRAGKNRAAAAWGAPRGRSRTRRRRDAARPRERAAAAERGRALPADESGRRGPAAADAAGWRAACSSSSAFSSATGSAAAAGSSAPGSAGGSERRQASRLRYACLAGAEPAASSTAVLGRPLRMSGRQRGIRLARGSSGATARPCLRRSSWSG